MPSTLEASESLVRHATLGNDASRVQPPRRFFQICSERSEKDIESTTFEVMRNSILQSTRIVDTRTTRKKTFRRILGFKRRKNRALRVALYAVADWQGHLSTHGASPVRERTSDAAIVTVPRPRRTVAGDDARAYVVVSPNPFHPRARSPERADVPSSCRVASASFVVLLLASRSFRYASFRTSRRRRDSSRGWERTSEEER